MSPLNVGYFWFHLYLVLGSRRCGALVGSLWIHNLVLSICAASSVIWLGWDIEICVVRLSCSLEPRLPIVLRCSSTLFLFRIIGFLSSLGLPHIFIGVMQWGGLCPFYSYNWFQNLPALGWNLCPCLGVSRVLGRFLLLYSHKVWGVPWSLHALWSLIVPGRTLLFRLWHICIRHFDYFTGHTCLLSLGK